MDKIRVGIVIFDQVEVLDYCGPFEVFSATRLHDESRHGTESPFDVMLVSHSLEPIVTTGGMKVFPQVTLASCPALDVLLVPGGWGARTQMKDPMLLQWIRDRDAGTGIIASVCTGALVLGSAGILDGHAATTHWQSLDVLHDAFPHVAVDYDRQYVCDGRVFTSAGVSAGIDLALKLVEHHFGPEVARSTARYMEYPFPETDARRVAAPGRSGAA